MRRVFSLMLGALALAAVAMVSAFITMRLAIHGREAVVPALTGLTVDDAAKLAAQEGLGLTLENKFYASGVAAGHVIAQDPAAGARVRRDWPVRVTESLGAQSVAVPDVTGESERAATVSLRRLGLELGVVAHLAAPGDPDMVLTQSPTANGGAVDSPRVSLLVSDAQETAAAQAYVMPQLTGLAPGAAEARASAAGLRLVLAAGTGTIVSQSPQAGRRVVQGDVVYATPAGPAAGDVGAVP